MKANQLKNMRSKEKGNSMRYITYLLLCTMSIFLLVGCSKKSDATNTSAQSEGADAVSSASLVDNATAFEKSISSEGNWIICLTKDLTVDKDLVIDGSFTNGKQDENGKDVVQRKVALYAQDADRKITDRYTLTVPKLTIKSPNASLQHGKFVGDIIVDEAGFQLIDNTVEGNIYFTSQEVKDSFTMDDTSSVTGVQEIQK